MNVISYIKCDVCGCITKVKVQAGWLKEHPVAIYCGNCSILIEGKVIQDPDEGKIAMQFKNAAQIQQENIGKIDYFVESSGEFVTMKMTTGDDINVMLSSVMPPFIRNAYSDKLSMYRHNFAQLLKFKEERWQAVRRVFELWSNRSDELYLRQELRKNLINPREYGVFWQQEGLHILFQKVGRFMMFDEKRVCEIKNDMKKMPYKEINGLCDFFDERGHLINCKRRIYEITNQFIDKFQYMMPAYFELLKNADVDFDQDGITTTSFETLKDFYISCYELLGDMVPVINGLNNILLRNRFDDSGEAKIKYEDLLFKPNSIKIKNFIPEEKFSKLTGINFNDNMRNAIGHYDYKIDGKSQKIVYTRSTDHNKTKEYQNEIYLLKFTIECLKLFQSIVYMEEMIYLLETKNYSEITKQQDNSYKKIYPNDLCPCGSGMKYKKCCGAGTCQNSIKIPGLPLM